MGYPLQMGCAMLSAKHFEVKFTSREVSARSGPALLKKLNLPRITLDVDSVVSQRFLDEKEVLRLKL